MINTIKNTGQYPMERTNLIVYPIVNIGAGMIYLE